MSQGRLTRRLGLRRYVRVGPVDRVSMLQGPHVQLSARAHLRHSQAAIFVDPFEIGC